MESWIIDARYAVRRLVRRPTYFVLATLTLALGGGGTAAISAIARRLLLDPLPVAREHEIASFWMRGSWSEEEFSHLRGRFPGFADVAAYRPRDLTLQQDDAPTRLLPGIATTAEFFTVLGVNPILGRAFQKGDDEPGAEPVAVLSYSLWQELGGDRDILGRSVRLDGQSRTVVGVMPRGFWFPTPTIRVWTPAPVNPERRAGMYSFVGRVAPGRQISAMAPALERLRAMLDERFDYPPQWDKLASPTLTPIRRELVGPLRPALAATLVAITLTLLIACANVAALMLGQVEGRTTELAVRAALGAERLRLVQQLIAESLLIGVAAGVVGAAIAAVSFRLLIGALPLGAWGETATLDWSVFWLAMAVGVVASLLVGAVPAYSLWRGQLRDVISRSRTGGIAGRGGRLESGLVVVEVALAVVMAAGAALLTRSVINLYAIDPGVTTEGVAVLDVAMGADLNTAQRHQVMRGLTDALGSLPGVEIVGATSKLPLRGSGDNWGITVEGRPDLERTTTAYRMVSRDYLPTLGLTAARGRGFEISDQPNGERVVVINEALAAKYFADVDPVGRRIGSGFDTTWARIVGVVRNAAEAGLTDGAMPTRYMFAEQVPFMQPGQVLVLRVSEGESADAILDAARAAVQRVAPSVAVQNATTMSHVLDRALGLVRQVVTLLLLLTGLALVLGAIGVYGVISHFAHRRQRDWGIRLALGLRPSHVVRQVVGRGAGLVTMGIALGVVLSLVLVRVMATLLYGVGASDPLAYGAAALTLLLIGIVAAGVPAHRASRVDPVLVLREE
ncbi:MAG: ADOP family duplicated permease [Gemmatimonadaceae bacterium]